MSEHSVVAGDCEHRKAGFGGPSWFWHVTSPPQIAAPREVTLGYGGAAVSTDLLRPRVQARLVNASPKKKARHGAMPEAVRTLRHSYAASSFCAAGVPAFDLTRYMGTSLRMIDINPPATSCVDRKRPRGHGCCVHDRRCGGGRTCDGAGERLPAAALLRRQAVDVVGTPPFCPAAAGSPGSLRPALPRWMSVP